jgi:TRAP-type C4-dicarboxylate transport system permease small subunit
MILTQKKYLETILCILLVAIVGVSFIQVLFRYLLHLSLAWSEEMARYLFLWLAGLTSAYAFKTKSHFALRFMINKLGPRGQRILGSLVTGLVAIFLLLFTWKAVEYTVSVSNQTSPSMQISMAVPYSSAVVGGALMLYYLLKNWWAERNK